MNAQNDATQAQAKVDTDAYGDYDLAADARGKRYRNNSPRPMPTWRTRWPKQTPLITRASWRQYVGAQVAYDRGVEGAVNDYISTVAPAWAASIIAASGNGSGTTAWANAWAAYMIATVSEGGDSQSQEDTVFQSTEDEMLDLGPGLSAQVSAAASLTNTFHRQ